jgi:hypothetical protein
MKSTKDAIGSALKTSRNRLFALETNEYYFDGNCGHIKGYKCEYYKKPVGKEKLITYKILMYVELQSAFEKERDLYEEIRNLVILAPSEFSHDSLLEDYAAVLADEAIINDKAKEKREKIARERHLQKQQEAVDRSNADKAMTDPEEIKQRELEKAEMHKIVSNLVNGQRTVGDSSGDDDEDDDDDDDDDDVDSVAENEEEKEVEEVQQSEDAELQRSMKVVAISSNSIVMSRNNDNAIDTFEVQTEPQEQCGLLESASVKGGEEKRRHHKKPLSSSSSSSRHVSGDQKSSRHHTSSSSSSKHHRDTYGSKQNSKHLRPSDNDETHKSSRSSKSSDRRLMKGNSKSKRKHKCKSGASTTRSDSSSSEDSEDSALDEREDTPQKDANKSSSLHQKTFAPGSNFILRAKNDDVVAVESEPYEEVSLLQLRQLSSNKQKVAKLSSRKDIVCDMVDDTVGGETPNFLTNLNGHPQENSLLHDIDESLTHVRKDYSSNEEELGYESHDKENAAFKVRGTSTSPLLNKSKRKRSKKIEDPVKTAEKLAAAEATAAKREERELAIKKSRHEQVFQRRVLEANVGNVVTSAGEGSSRKRRMTSGLSQGWENFYGDNLAINLQCTRTDRTLINGCAASLLGDVNNSINDSNSLDGDFSVVSSYRAQSGLAADIVLKEKLMKHLQMDIFKEITFERLIAEYSVAKRAACGANDDEIVDIDWFEVLHEFRVVLKSRLSTNSKSILLRIHESIDHDDRIVDKHAAKLIFTSSMGAFIKHGFRTINSVVNKTIHKLGTHFDSVNFSSDVPKFATYEKKSKGYAFAFHASLYNLLGDENVSSSAMILPSGDLFGIDPLLSEVMKSKNQDQHMKDTIKYKLVKKTMYIDSPANYGALRKYLEKKSKESPVKSALNVSDAVSITGTDFDDDADDVDGAVDFDGNNDEDSDKTADVNELTSTPVDVSKQLFASSSPSIERSHSARSASSVEVNNIISLDGADKLVNPVVLPLSYLAESTQSFRQLLELLISDVKEQDLHLFLKFNLKNNVRNTRNLQLIKFLEIHQDLEENALYDLFCESSYFKTLSTSMFIPFKLSDQYSIKGDGYCFYRSLFMLLLRKQSGYRLTASELTEIDDSLKSNGESSESLRLKFQDFFTRIETLFPDQNAKSKVVTAKYTFIHLKTYLDERFWGGSDSVPFLDYSCTAFSYNKSESTLVGCWAKMFCSSIPGLVNGRETLDYDKVGGAYSLSDILMVLMQEHNWLLHKTVHFFIADHPTTEVFLRSFKSCLTSMLNQLRDRIKTAKGQETNWTFAQLYDNIVDGVSQAKDSVLLLEAKSRLENMLMENKACLEEVEEEMEETYPQHFVKKKEFYIPTPSGASPAEKQYFSNINDEVNYFR